MGYLQMDFFEMGCFGGKRRAKISDGVCGDGVEQRGLFGMGGYLEEKRILGENVKFLGGGGLGEG
jgi:hypothetical protein